MSYTLVELPRPAIDSVRANTKAHPIIEMRTTKILRVRRKLVARARSLPSCYCARNWARFEYHVPPFGMLVASRNGSPLLGHTATVVNPSAPMSMSALGKNGLAPVPPGALNQPNADGAHRRNVAHQAELRPEVVGQVRRVAIYHARRLAGTGGRRIGVTEEGPVVRIATVNQRYELHSGAMNLRGDLRDGQAIIGAAAASRRAARSHRIKVRADLREGLGGGGGDRHQSLRETQIRRRPDEHLPAAGRTRRLRRSLCRRAVRPVGRVAAAARVAPPRTGATGPAPRAAA